MSVPKVDANTLDALVPLSSRGGITLPATMRRAMGLRPGDLMRIRMEDGKIVLEPVVVVPVEMYSEERISEFTLESEMTETELEEARRRWRQR